jgi:hypothetical protein
VSAAPSVSTGVRVWSLPTAADRPDWAALCGPGDLFCTPDWLAVEQAAVGPWVPRRAACLALDSPDGVLAGCPVQLFDLAVDDETVRLDKMLAPPADPAAVQPSLLCGTWFNSSVLTAPGRSAAAAASARGAVVAAAEELARSWGAATVFFPFLDAAATDLRAELGRAGFREFPAPARHVFDSRHEGYDSWVASLRSRRRTRLRREQADVQRAGLRTATVAVDDAGVEQLARLAHSLERKYEQTATVAEMAAWFTEIARRTEAIAFVVRPPEPAAADPIAMTLWLRHQDALYGFHAGFDYTRAHGLPLYSLAGYHLPMRHACADPTINTLEYGVSSDEAKLLRGTTALPQVLAVKPLTAAAAAALGS